MVTKLITYVVIIVHHVYVLAFLVAVGVILITQPWYYGFIALTVLVRVATSKSPCVITDIENYCRRRACMKRIGGFVGHYYKKPLHKLHNYATLKLKRR